VCRTGREEAPEFVTPATEEKRRLTMHQRLLTLAIATVLAVSPAATMVASADHFERDDDRRGCGPNVQLSSRPFYLVDAMTESRRKKTLQKCMHQRVIYQKSDFSIGH
jgi:hypothetical protein